MPPRRSSAHLPACTRVTHSMKLSARRSIAGMQKRYFRAFEEARDDRCRPHTQGDQIVSSLRFGPDEPSTTYIPHAFAEQTIDTGEVMINYATAGASDKPA